MFGFFAEKSEPPYVGCYHKVIQIAASIPRR
jgi:hypothetical protein